MTTLEVPAASREPADPRTARPARAVVRQLAPVEARRFAGHPLLWIGVLLGAWMFLADVLALRFVLPRESIHIQNVALPIGAAALFIAHLATTRPRRDDVTEVLEPAVHGDDTRTLALLLASLTPAVLTAGLVAVALGTMAALGAVGPVWWAEAATAPAIVAGAGVLGVLLGRIAPWRLTPLFALVAVVAVQFLVLDPGATTALDVEQLLGPLLVPAMGLPDPAALLRPASLHLVYVLGVTGGLAAIAVLVGRATGRRVVVLVVTLAVTVAAGIAQMAPPDDAAADELLARASTPAEAGECTADGTGATVCVLPTHRGWRPGWVDVVRSVRQPLVDRGVDPGPLTVAQRAEPSQVAYDLSRWYDREELDADPRLEAAWDAEHLAPPGTVLATSYWRRGSADADPSRLDLAAHVAREATGLPVGFWYLQDGPGESFLGIRSCDPAGQAREPVTLWLAAQADPAAEGALRQAVADQPDPGRSDAPIDGASGTADALGRLHLATPAVAGVTPTWSQTGAHVALQLLDRPDDEVLATWAGEWDRWTDPATSLRELTDELGLTMPPFADDLRAEFGDDVPAEELDRAFRDTPLPLAELGPDGTVDYADEQAYEAAPVGCP